MAALRRVICSGALRLLPSLSQRIRPQTVLTQSQTLTSRSQSAVLQSLRWYSAEKTKFDDHYYANVGCTVYHSHTVYYASTVTNVACKRETGGFIHERVTVITNGQWNKNAKR